MIRTDSPPCMTCGTITTPTCPRCHKHLELALSKRAIQLALVHAKDVALSEQDRLARIAMLLESIVGQLAGVSEIDAEDTADVDPSIVAVNAEVLRREAERPRRIEAAFAKPFEPKGGGW